MIRRNLGIPAIVNKGILVLVFLFASFSSSYAQERIEAVAELLKEHKFNKIHDQFTEYYASEVKKKRLREGWKNIEKSFGEYKEFKFIKRIPSGRFTKEEALLKFEAGAVQLEVSYDKHGDIAILILRLPSYSPPPYIKEIVFGRRTFEIQTPQGEVPGEMMIPTSGDSCPLILFVHGSGPVDRDETMGPNKVFYDLALGLAQRGISTFRYEKRSKVYPEFFEGQFDLYDETIDDAVAAVKLLQSQEGLRYTKLIVLGHSLGAYALPLIAEKVEGVDGFILMAGPSGKLEELIEYQVKYLQKFDDSWKMKRVVRKAEKRADKISEGDYDDKTKAKKLLAYWPGSFWESIASYDPVQTLSKQRVNALVLQGKEDFQVPVAQFETWKESNTNPNAKFVSYDSLNHLFMPMMEEGPADYFRPNNVSEQVINDIADWTEAL
ncbi:DUF3887 domain-containing protein [bacterium]|nr:DUF3887 domain-containing protein [bacterium]